MALSWTVSEIFHQTRFLPWTLGLQWAISRLNGTKLPTGVLTFTVKIAFGSIFWKPFKIESKFKKWPKSFFNFALFLFSKHFSSCKTDGMPAVLSSKWKWTWQAWFLCHNPFLQQNQYNFSRCLNDIDRTYDKSISFWFQNFP